MAVSSETREVRILSAPRSLRRIGIIHHRSSPLSAVRGEGAYRAHGIVHQRACIGLLPLDAGALDHARPLVEVLADEIAELIGPERKRCDLLFRELLDDLWLAHDRERFLREPRHDLLRRSCWRDDADPRRHFETGHRFSDRRYVG